MSSPQPAAGTRVRLARLERRRGLDGGSRRLRGAFIRGVVDVADVDAHAPFVFSAPREAGVSGARRGSCRVGRPSVSSAVLGVASASASAAARISTAAAIGGDDAGQSLDVGVSRLFAGLFERGRRRAERRLRAAERRGRRGAGERTRRNPTSGSSPGPSPETSPRAAPFGAAGAPRPDEVFSLRTRGEVFCSEPGGASSAQTPRGGVERPCGVRGGAVGEPGSDGFDASSSTSSYSSESLAERGPPSTRTSLGNAGVGSADRRTAPREPQNPIQSSEALAETQTRRARAVRRRAPRGERAQRGGGDDGGEARGGVVVGGRRERSHPASRATAAMTLSAFRGRSAWPARVADAPRARARRRLFRRRRRPARWRRTKTTARQNRSSESRRRFVSSPRRRPPFSRRARSRGSRVSRPRQPSSRSAHHPAPAPASIGAPPARL